MVISAPYRGLYAYGWDVAEWDADRFVDELQRLGLNTLTLAASYHAGKFTRPHGRSGKVFFPEDGCAHCRVRPERYGSIKPKTSYFSASNDVLGTFSERSDVAVNAWMVLLHNSRLGALHPDCVTRNAFGDPYVYSLCPSAGPVRDYAVALCADVADAYAVDSLTLETPGWLPYRHGYHHEFALLPSMPGTEMLLGLCFCANCMQNAKKQGIDAEGVRLRAEGHIRGALEAAFDPAAETNRSWALADLVLDADLAAYHRMRCDVVTRLVADIRAEVRKDVRIHVIPSVNQPVAHSWLEGSDLAALSQVADGLEVCFYSAPWQAAATELEEIRSRIGTSATLRAVLRPAPPDYLEEGAFRSTVTALNAGVDGLAFYNFGHVRAANLEWIGRALQALP